jgi:hypothetical protein
MVFNAITIDEFGNDPGPVLVWTGTLQDGTAASTTCFNWTSNSGFNGRPPQRYRSIEMESHDADVQFACSALLWRAIVDLISGIDEGVFIEPALLAKLSSAMDQVVLSEWAVAG